MKESELIDYIIVTFPGVDVVSSSGDFFFIYDPDRLLPPGARNPWATLITTDRLDGAEHEAYFRLNIHLGKKAFNNLFSKKGILHDGHEHDGHAHDGHAHNGHSAPSGDDKIFPHPVYGRMFWCTVVNPGEHTTDLVKRLLKEAYDETVKKYGASRGRAL